MSLTTDALMDAARAGLALLAPVARDLARIAEGGSPPPAPRFDQDWFPPLDAAMAYAFLRHWRPARLVEVGAGHSTRFFAAAAADGGFALDLTVIDPGEKAARKLGALPVRHVALPLEAADPAPFAALTLGDVASLDGSHRFAPGNDVDVFFHRILPRLPAGVRVHVHDIFLPDPYPPDWAARRYDEQEVLRPLIEAGALRILFASHFAATRLAAEVARSPVGPLLARSRAPAASLWLETVAPVTLM